MCDNGGGCDDGGVGDPGGHALRVVEGVVKCAFHLLWNGLSICCVVLYPCFLPASLLHHTTTTLAPPHTTPPPPRCVHRWLLANNVTVMINDVKWAKRLYSKKKSNFSHFSHLYSSPELMIGTLQRVDIPIQPQLQQYNYVLYTDADVLFAQPLYWTDFPLPLPETISMSFEADTIVPCNAGVWCVCGSVGVWVWKVVQWRVWWCALNIPILVLFM